jgi:soluble lytic murein transglycosylase
MQFRTILTLIAAVVACGAQAQPRGDDLILDMHQAYKRGDTRKLTQMLPQLRGHALEPWAAYWELRARLDSASVQEIQDFLTRWAGTYQEDRLRNDWLLMLGQRRDWTTFEAEYPKFRMNDDREVRCYALLVQHLTQGAAAPATLAGEVRRNWYAQRDADDGCAHAASRLIGERDGARRTGNATGMTVQDAWVKARLATEANRPRAATKAVEIVSPESLPLVAELNASPVKFLTSRVTAMSKVRKELITLALIKLAVGDAEGAARQLDSKWGPQLSAEERNWVWGVIGKQAASRLSRRHGLLRQRQRDSDLSDDMLGWKVRAALRAGNKPRWADVLSAVNGMSDEAQRDPAWTYWKARALLAASPNTSPNPSDKRTEALALLERIASPRGFYEQLALEELGRKMKKTPRARMPAWPRAVCHPHRPAPEGVREWNYSTNLHTSGGMSDRELLAAADLACQTARCGTAASTPASAPRRSSTWSSAFPCRSATRWSRSREIGLDPAYVYGLIRQESRFIMDARSHVGASGLMQVMPATARWTAKKIGLTNFTPDQINDRDTNIAIGTGYLKLVLDDFGGSMPLAAAAYNAGPGRPRNWRNGPVMEAAIWAENVPFLRNARLRQEGAVQHHQLRRHPERPAAVAEGTAGTVGPRAAF